MKLVEHMAIGRPSRADQELIDEQMNVLELDDHAREPMRRKVSWCIPTRP
jgi:hypothetical protein